MDRNTFTGLFLILVILVGSFFLMKPSEDEIKKERQKQHQDSLLKAGQNPQVSGNNVPVVAEKKTVTLDSAQLKGAFGTALMGTNQFVTLENKDIRVQVSAKGGRISSIELKNYKTFDKKPLILFDGDLNHFGLKFNAGGKNINTNDLFFKPSSDALKLAGSDSGSVTMRLSYGEGQFIDYVYSLKGEGYKVGFNIVLNGLNQVITPKNNVITLNWEASLRKQEKDIKMERQYSTPYLKYVEGDIKHLSPASDEDQSFADSKVQWISFKQHFFSNVLIAKQGFNKVNLAVSTDINSTDVKQMKASMDLAYNNQQAITTYPMEFYFGPNRFSTLKREGYDLQKQVDLGWGPLKYINQFAVLPVFTFLEKFHWSYGLIILVLTVLLKLVLFPLTYKSYMSMAKMRVLKPEMDDIKSKVGDDNATLLQQEYLKLYKKAGVNPLGGCLPMLLQMPIIIAFFSFFPSLFELRGESFLWMKDLSTYDNFIDLGFTIPFIGNHISLMCFLMTISTLIYTYFNNQVSGATGQMKYIGYITPVIFFGVLNSYPAGLNYYYFCANVLTFSQQYFIRLMVDDDKIHARIQENKKKPEDPAKKKSGFQKRMEDYMRQQQQLPKSTAKKK
ncbi:MAG: membrane protein insertase YidC [Sphingobacteriaceae bacterium]